MEGGPSERLKTTGETPRNYSPGRKPESTDTQGVVPVSVTVGNRRDGVVYTSGSSVLTLQGSALCVVTSCGQLCESDGRILVTSPQGTWGNTSGTDTFPGVGTRHTESDWKGHRVPVPFQVAPHRSQPKPPLQSRSPTFPLPSRDLPPRTLRSYPRPLDPLGYRGE